MDKLDAFSGYNQFSITEYGIGFLDESGEWGFLYSKMSVMGIPFLGDVIRRVPLAEISFYLASIL